MLTIDAVVARHSSNFGNTFVLFPDRLREVFSVLYEKSYLVVYYINHRERIFTLPQKNNVPGHHCIDLIKTYRFIYNSA